MTENSYDVAIIGSGPSGATSAFYLAKNGLKVVIIEKEKLPRYKTCGGGLVFRGRSFLPFELSTVVEKEFHSIDVYFSGTNIHLSSERNVPIVSMIMRDKFDHLIVEESQKMGVKLLENNKVNALEYKNEYIQIKTSQTEIQAKFIIAADGALSSTAKLAGWEKDTRYLVPALEYEIKIKAEKFQKLSEEARFDIDFIPQGYAWNFPKKEHLSIGVASFKRSKINLKKYYQDYLLLLGIEESDILEEKANGFQIPISARTDGFVKNNVFLIGDAAGFADPITAEGISNAIYSGKLAAEALVESKLDAKLAEQIYLQKLQAKLLPELKTANFLSKIFYNQLTLRNYLIKKHGERFCEYLTDIFVGERHYPKSFVKTVKSKLKKLVFN